MSQILLVLVLLMLGYGFGRRAEKRHYRSIVEREKKLAQLPCVASRFPPQDQPYHQILVDGSVVVASDYFKTLLAGMVNFFGGRVISYESLLDRARREAILRMKEKASLMQADYVFNVKLETAVIGGSRTGSIEVLAYGTALIPAARSMT